MDCGTCAHARFEDLDLEMEGRGFYGGVDVCVAGKVGVLQRGGRVTSGWTCV